MYISAALIILYSLVLWKGMLIGNYSFVTINANFSVNVLFPYAEKLPKIILNMTQKNSQRNCFLCSREGFTHNQSMYKGISLLYLH